ncbi:MAG: VTT domain-containing protein, partial [Planctomycetota bacterium]
MQKVEENKNIQQRNIKALVRELWRPVLLLSFLVVALVLAKVLGLVGRLVELQDWIKGLETLGYVVFVFIHIGAMIAVIPRSMLAVIAGIFFGSVVGIILVTISAPIGAGLTFLIARYFAQDATARLLSRNQKINKLYQLTEKHGAIIVAMVRLLLISPSCLLNYGFGLTKIRFFPYVFWSCLTMLPATVVYVIGADAITEGISQARIPWTLVSSVII